MKLYYETPMIKIELFTPNKAIAECSANQDVILQCIQGGNVDSNNIFCEAAGTSPCTIEAGFAKNIFKARNDSSNGSSITSSTKNWTWVNNVASYTGTGAAGLVYLCVDFDGKQLNHTWTQEGDVMVHTPTTPSATTFKGGHGGSGGREHCQIGVVTATVGMAS